jgi:hypothetical protein
MAQATLHVSDNEAGITHVRDFCEVCSTVQLCSFERRYQTIDKDWMNVFTLTFYGNSKQSEINADLEIIRNRFDSCIIVPGG